MAYVTAFTTHFRAVQAWGERAGAELQLDVRRFELEVKCRGRYRHFHPQFFGRVAGRFGNTSALTPETQGFAGWLPYRPYTFELARDKLRFKAFCRAQGLATPPWWDFDPVAAPPPSDYILKRSAGSYGLELAGPFRAGAWPQEVPEGSGETFAEAFVDGEVLKLWCWGSRPFYAQVRPFSRVRGDARATARELAALRLKEAGLPQASSADWAAIETCLAYQSLSLDAVVPQGGQPFIDYRYGRDHGNRDLSRDDALPSMAPALREQMGQAARVAAEALRRELPAPVLFSLDGVIDACGQVAWLEMNSNPTLPPDGYAEMFLDLFGA